MEDEKSFSLVEIIFGTIAAITIDVIAAFASAFSLGILGFFVHAGTWLIFTLWFTIKGVNVTASLAKRYLLPMMVQAIPFLPTTTATFLMITYMENNPEKFAAVETATNIAGTIAKL